MKKSSVYSFIAFFIFTSNLMAQSGTEKIFSEIGKVKQEKPKQLKYIRNLN